MPPKKSRKVTAVVRIQQPAGAANVAKVGQVLGAHGINIVQVMKEFNEATEQYRGLDVAADITIFDDRSTSVAARTPTTSSLIKRALSIQKGSSTPGISTVGTVPASVVQDVARQKLPDLNTDDLDEAVKVVAGSARSMGLKVEV
ncbi:MAG: uL11 family ribosomal protein [Angustibacter sp.]